MPERRRRFPLSRATRPIRPPIYTATIKQEATIRTPMGTKLDLSPIGGPKDLWLGCGTTSSMSARTVIHQFLTIQKRAHNIRIDDEWHSRLILCTWETPPRYSAKIRSYWAARNVCLPE